MVCFSVLVLIIGSCAGALGLGYGYIEKKYLNKK